MRNKNNIKKKGQMYKQQQIKESKIKYNLKMKRMKIPKKKKENMSEVIFALEWKKFPSSKQQKKRKEKKAKLKKDVHLKRAF